MYGSTKLLYPLGLNSVFLLCFLDLRHFIRQHHIATVHTHSTINNNAPPPAAAIIVKWMPLIHGSVVVGSGSLGGSTNRKKVTYYYTLDAPSFILLHI